MRQDIGGRVDVAGGPGLADPTQVPPGTTAESADRPVERYTARIDPPDLIAGGTTTREENQ